VQGTGRAGVSITHLPAVALLTMRADMQDGGCPVAVFFADTGERLGTFMGHSGAVVNVDLTRATPTCLPVSGAAGYQHSRSFEHWRCFGHAVLSKHETRFPPAHGVLSGKRDPAPPEHHHAVACRGLEVAAERGPGQQRPAVGGANRQGTLHVGCAPAGALSSHTLHAPARASCS
jgi:hypothetical protein